MLGLQRFAGGITSQIFRRSAFSSSGRGVTSVAVPHQGTALSDTSSDVAAEAAGATASQKAKNPMVAAAFESLRNETPDIATANDIRGEQKVKAPRDSNLDERIIKAKTVNGLLAVTETNGPISRKHALKIVSILADWSSMNRVKISEFENDTRFLRICRMLGRTVPKNGSGGGGGGGVGNGNNSQKPISGFRTDDLNTVLGVAGDDEAAKLIASISVPQMVKVMSTLAQRKRRSTPLLRSLAYNISSSTTEALDLKQSADVLYAMASLNFQDSVLAAKICADIQATLPRNTEKSAVVGSILTSLGILKYRDLDILESLTQWTLKHDEICRPQDVSALFLTSAMLNFRSAQIEDVGKKLVKCIVREDFTKHVEWLNHIWALTMLRLVDNQQLETVLCEDFTSQLQTDGIAATSKMKLLNLNSFAQLVATDYKGPLLTAGSVVFDVPMAHVKSKQTLLNGMLDALKSLLPANNHVRTLLNSNMGFLIDALCLFDNKRNPLPLDKENANAIKVALMVVDYHDICHGPHRAASGVTNLSFDLLERSGYKVIAVPYNEFNTSDKLLKRVQYLEAKFKATISSGQ